MKRYRVFLHPSGDAEAIKQGWSWPAALFGFFWAPFKRMWALSIGGLAATLLLGYVAAMTSNADTAASVMNLVLLVVGVVFGVKGNAWREANLIKRGFVPTGMAIGKSAESAITQVQRTPS